MPGTPTPNLGLTLPIGSDTPAELRVAITNNANILDGFSLLTSVGTAATSVTATRGEVVLASPGVTVTLPAATVNAMVAVVASSTVTGASPITVAGVNIYGVGLVGAASFKLGTPGAVAVLFSDGTNWEIILGQQDTGWVGLTLAGGVTGSGYVPSARLQGDIVRLKGAMSGSSITAGSTWATIPSGLRPSVALNFPASQTLVSTGLAVLAITGGGVISTSVGTGISTEVVSLDEITYTLS